MRLDTYVELFDKLTTDAYDDCVAQAKANNIGLMLTEGQSFIVHEYDDDDRVKKVEVVAVAFVENKIYVLTDIRVSDNFRSAFDAISINAYKQCRNIELLNTDNGLYVFHNTNDTKNQEHKFWTLETYMSKFGGASVMLEFLYKFKDALETRF